MSASITGFRRGRFEGPFGQYALRLAVLAAVIVYFFLTVPGFRVGGLTATIDGFALLGLVSLGIGVTMLAGELDMSVASVAACSGIVAVLLAPTFGLPVAVVAATLLSAGFGLAQGWLIGALGLNSLVLTIGSSIALSGLAYIATGGTAILVPDFSITDILLWRLGPFRIGTFVTILVFVFVACFLRYTRYGREIYAVGGGRREAASSGVPLRRSLSISFSISAGCAGLAGAMAALRSGSGSPNAFPELLLAAAAAALVGGISIYGGRGTVWNIILGVAIITVVQAGLVAQRAQSYEAQAIIGVLLVGIVGLELISARISGRRRLMKQQSTEKEDKSMGSMKGAANG